MNQFNSYLNGKSSVLKTAVEKINTEWLRDLQSEMIIPKYLFPIFNWHQEINQGLAGTLLMLSATSFGCTDKKTMTTLAAYIETLQVSLLIRSHFRDQAWRQAPNFQEKISQILASRGHIHHETEAEKISLSISNHLLAWLNNKVLYLAIETAKPEIIQIFNQYVSQTTGGQLANSMNESIPTDLLEIKDLYVAQTSAQTFCLPFILGYVLARPEHTITQELILEVVGENLGIILQSKADLKGFNEGPDTLSKLRLSLINHEPSLWLILLMEKLNEGEKIFLEKIWKTQIIADADLYYLRYLFQKYNVSHSLRKAITSESKLCRQLITDLELPPEYARLWYSLVDHLENQG